MDRRGFLKFFSAGVAGIALEQAIPLGRVWSFPKKIVIAGPELTIDRLRPFITAARFNIGDIVSFPAFGPELYAVSDIDDDGTIQIYNSGVKGLVAPSAVRGLRPYQITPAFRPGKFL